MGYFQVRYDSRVVYYDCRAFENWTREREREDDKNEQKSSAKIALTFCCFNAPKLQQNLNARSSFRCLSNEYALIS